MDPDAIDEFPLDHKVETEESTPPCGVVEQVKELHEVVATLVDILRTLKNDVVELKANKESTQPRDPASTASYPPKQAPFSQISCRDALELVPSYTGYNIPVSKFVRSCKRARDALPDHLEKQLTLLIRNKLKGHAAIAIDDEEFDTIDKLTEKLKTIFAPSKSIHQYRGELGNVVKGRDEHIIAYIGRVKELHSIILELTTETNGQLTKVQTRSLQGDTLDCFVKGLPPDFRLRLKLEGYNSLESAYSRSIQVGREIERDQSVFFNKGSKKETAERQPNREKNGCEHCGGPHKSEECWTKFPEKRPKPTGVNRDRVNPGDNAARPARKNLTNNKDSARIQSGNPTSRPVNEGVVRVAMQEHPHVEEDESEMFAPSTST